MSSFNRSFLPPLSHCQPSLHTPHPPCCPTSWCTCFDLFVLSSSPGVPDVVEPALKRQRLSNAGDLVAPSWLKEIHSKIWGCKKLESELFRTVKVTRADYDKLQGDLKEKHPGRDSPQYDGKMVDVRSEKLAFLLWTLTMVRRQATRTILKSIHSFHSLSDTWICQLSSSSTRQTASLPHFSFVKSMIISRS